MSDVFAQAASDIMETLKPAGGAHDAQLQRGTAEPIPVSVIISMNLSTWGDGMQIANGTVGISILRADLPERPRRGDHITLADSRAFDVEQPLASDDYIHRALCLEVTP